jgi:NhaP-type Na+/H+ or K+/H+ antiporter
MALFEITLLLLAIAVVLLQVARHLRVPYPAMLALAGGCVAALPFAPHLSIEPRLALALFVAPAVMPFSPSAPGYWPGICHCRPSWRWWRWRP